MGTAEIAHAIMPVYLWWFGYQMDDESLRKCHESIEIQRHEDEEYHATTFVLVIADEPVEGTVEQPREASARELPWLHYSSQQDPQ